MGTLAKESLQNGVLDTTGTNREGEGGRDVRRKRYRNREISDLSKEVEAGLRRGVLRSLKAVIVLSWSVYEQASFMVDSFGVS